MSPHPRHELDDALLTPIRFSLVAALPRELELDFRALRDLLEVSDSVLSKALAHLHDVGYVRVRKSFYGSRPQTWVKSTSKGRKAFAQHAAALQAIAEGSTGQ